MQAVALVALPVAWNLLMPNFRDDEKWHDADKFYDPSYLLRLLLPSLGRRSALLLPPHIKTDSEESTFEQRQDFCHCLVPDNVHFLQSHQA